MSLGKQTQFGLPASHVHLAILLMDISIAIPKISVSCFYRLYFFITSFWILSGFVYFPCLNWNACIAANVYAWESVRFDSFTIRCFLRCTIWDIRWPTLHKNKKPCNFSYNFFLILIQVFLFFFYFWSLRWNNRKVHSMIHNEGRASTHLTFNTSQYFDHVITLGYWF